MKFGEYFKGHPANNDGNKNMEAFTNALSGDKTVEDQIKIASYDAGGGVLGADAEKKIVILHSLKNLGGLLLRPANKIVALVGMDENPMGVIISNPCFCTGVKKQGPGLEKFQECNSRKDLDDLQPNQKGMYNGANIFMLAPWIVQSILNADTYDPLSLIPVILKDAEEFDNNNKNVMKIISVPWTTPAP